jgi:hypothetical protein
LKSIIGLAERKERKRSRQAVLKPAMVQAASQCADSAKADDKTKGKKILNKKAVQGKVPKIPAGLALMHGFSATNVGKNRLTVRDMF